jgi:hypothetical protein
MLLGQPSSRCVRCCWKPSGKFVIMGSEGIGNPLTNFLTGYRGYWQSSDKFLRGYWQLLQMVWYIFVRMLLILSVHCNLQPWQLLPMVSEIFVRMLPISLDPLPGGTEYPSEQLEKGTR